MVQQAKPPVVSKYCRSATRFSSHLIDISPSAWNMRSFAPTRKLCHHPECLLTALLWNKLGPPATVYLLTMLVITKTAHGFHRLFGGFLSLTRVNFVLKTAFQLTSSPSNHHAVSSIVPSALFPDLTVNGTFFLRTIFMEVIF